MLLTEQIEDFLQEYSRSRVVVLTTVRSICIHAAEYEQKLSKPVTEFTKEEMLEFYSSLGVISVTSLMNVNLVIKHLLNWIFYTKGVTSTNICEDITKDDLKPCVVQRTLITREQLDDLQAQLLNKTDVAILECLWLGMGNRWNTEITYLSPNQVSHNEMQIYFRNGKVIDINQRQYDILQAAFNEKELASYNPASTKVSKVSGKSIYKSRFNAKHSNEDKNSEEDAERRFRFLQRRMQIISDYLDIKLTPSLIQVSGLVHCVREGMVEHKCSYREFLHTEDCRKIARRFDILSQLYIQILNEKIGFYFE